MTRYPMKLCSLIVVYVALSLLDWVLTVYALSLGCHELNPLYAYTVKAWALLITVPLLLWLGHVAPKWALVGVVVLVAVYGVVCTLNTITLYNSLY